MAVFTPKSKSSKKGTKEAPLLLQVHGQENKVDGHLADVLVRHLGSAQEVAALAHPKDAFDGLAFTEFAFSGLRCSL